MATYKEIRNFLYSEDVKEKTEFLLKRYEPTNLDKLDILRVIYPIVKSYHYEIVFNKESTFEFLKASDDAIRRYLFPKSYIKKESCDKLFDKWVNGDEKSFDELLERNLHLPSLVLSKLGYSSPFDEDLYEVGMKTLVFYIKKYDKSYSNYISSYLHDKMRRVLSLKIKECNNNQESETDLASLKPNTPILYYSDSDDFSYDNIDDYVEEKSFNSLKMSIFKASHLSFIEKTSMMARFYFDNIDITNKELASCLNTNYKNFGMTIKRSLEKLQDQKNINDVNYSLFEYFLSDKRIVLHCMKNLQDEEIRLIKRVWGNDFLNLKDFEDINFTKEEVFLYLKAIMKIYKSIKIFVDDFNNNKIGYEIFSDAEKEEVTVKN